MRTTTRTAPLTPTRADAALNLKTILIIRAFLLARVAWWPVIAYAGSLLVHLAVLWALTDPQQAWGSGLTDKLTAWDGRLLLQISDHGYPNSFTYGEDGKLTGNNLAFMPLFPLVVRIVHSFTGINYRVCGILVAHVSFLVFLTVLCSLVSLLHGRRVAAVSTLLVAGVQPMGIVFFMSYTESMFCALAVGCLLAVYRRKWILAGVLCSLAGLTRPAGVAVCAALAVAVASYLVDRRQLVLRPVAGLLVGLLGLPLYLVWVGLRVGALNAWLTIQEAGWGTRWDNGWSSLRLMETAFTQGSGWVMISTAIMIAVITTIILSSWRTTWLPLVVYGSMIIVMTVGQSNYYHCKLRLLLPASFVVVIPIALALARAKNSTMYTSIVLGTFFSAWYGAYMLTIWKYAI